MCGCGSEAGRHHGVQAGELTAAAEPGGSLSRRGFLAAATVAGAAGVAILAPVRFASAATGATQTRTINGHFDIGAPDFVYVPVEVPNGVAQIDVSYSYNRPSVPAGVLGNALDIGMFDERGTALGKRAGFRGWSGGFRTSFSISNSDATPGYLPGPVNAGTWHVALGPYTVAPSGLDWTVQITLTSGPPGPAFQPDYPPLRAAGRGRAWYRGDSHLHTVYSDGRRLPSEVAAGARAAGLDFITSTDHNTSSSHAAWGPFAGSDLLIITGEEATTRNGHYVIAGLPAGTWIDWRYRARDGELPGFIDQIHGTGAIAVAAHPFATCLACNWKFGYAKVDAVEVWNGPWTADDEIAVQMWDGMLVQAAHNGGQWLPAMGDSDAHSEPQVIGLPHNVVLANDLTTDAIIAGLKAGRTWLAESSSVDLAFSAASGGKTAGIGERLDVGTGEPITVTLDVSGVPGGTAVLIADEGHTLSQALPASGAGTVTWQTTSDVSAYVRAEVRHPVSSQAADLPGAMAGMTNPVFLGQA
jgi:predicted metal-dependent phosphoesterase TrpH